MASIDKMNDPEALFDQYLKHTEPLSGEVQDFDLALGYLKKAASLKQPEATFVYGTLLYTGEGTPKNMEEGMRLMRLGRDLGAQMVGQVTQMMGIDLDSDDHQDISPEISAESSGIACRTQIDQLQKKGRITDVQRDDLYELVRTLDTYHLVNVLSVLNDQKSLVEMLSKGRITGWNSEQGTFYFSTVPLDVDTDGKTIADRNYFISILEKFKSEDSDTVLSAVHEINSRMDTSGITWDDLLIPTGDIDQSSDNEKTPTTEQSQSNDADLKLLSREEEDEIRGLVKSIKGLKISAATREELDEYITDLNNGDLAQMDLRYLHALKSRLTK